MAMAMESIYTLGEFIGPQIGCHTETTAGSTWVVEFGLYLGIFGVDAYSARNIIITLFYSFIETFIL